MKSFTTRSVVKLALGGGVAGLLGIAALGASATPVLAASTATPKPAASPAAPAKHADNRQDRRQVGRVVFESEADILGMKPQELREALRSGKTVEQLATAKGITKDQFADRLANNVKPGLDKLVDTHKITAAQEEAVVERIRAGHIPFWSHAGKHPATKKSA